LAEDQYGDTVTEWPARTAPSKSAVELLLQIVADFD